MPQSDWKSALDRTRQTAFGRVASLFGATELDDHIWEALEAQLVLADLGIRSTERVISSLKERAGTGGWTRRDQVLNALRQELVDSFLEPDFERFEHSPAVAILVGVNGSGKTTTAARLARYFQGRGQQVLLAAADTYRAAAVEQLERWAKRLAVELVKGEPGADPASVVYQAGEVAKRSGSDLVLVDTSGRMQTSHNLMAELEKICRVSGNVIEGAPHAVWLVLDATTGQNAISQARGFAEAVPVSGVVLAKLDTSARGGAAASIGEQLGLPILFAGVGEQLDDLIPFDRQEFVQMLLEPA